MDINDERLGPLCGDDRKTWLAYNTGPWDGDLDEARCVFYIDHNFKVHHDHDDWGYVDISELYLPLEYCL